MPHSIEEIRGAVARGWCSPANANKEMDATLAEAIPQEVWTLLHAPLPPRSFPKVFDPNP